MADRRVLGRRTEPFTPSSRLSDVDERRERFERLAEEVWLPLQRYLARRLPPADAEDVLGDVLVVLWRRLDDVPAEAVLPWCYGVARGCLANARRAEARRLRLVERLEQVPPAGEDPDLADALRRLRPDERELLRLWAWEGLEPRDLAVVLGCSPGAAASRLSRARQALAASLRQDPVAAGHRTGRGREERRA